MRTQRGIRGPWFVTLLLVAGLAPSLPAEEGLRQLRIGDTLPAFSLADTNGAVFRYEPQRSGVLAIVVLQTRQTNLERLVADLQALTKMLKVQLGPFDCVGVMSGPASPESQRVLARAGSEFTVFLDPNFSVWGKLGVIAGPTAVVVGADHRIQWVKAGAGFSFLADLHAQLARALGHKADAVGPVRVETLENDSFRARRDRHVQLARTLAKKGRWDAAVKELETLRQAEPNAVDIALELSETLCRAGKDEAGLKLLSNLKLESNPDRARALWIRARVQRQRGDLVTAQTLLTQALELERESARILYELGQVHQAKGDTAQALACYRRALAEVFGEADVAGASQR